MTWADNGADKVQRRYSEEGAVAHGDRPFCVI